MSTAVLFLEDAPGVPFNAKDALEPNDIRQITFCLQQPHLQLRRARKHGHTMRMAGDMAAEHRRTHVALSTARSMEIDNVRIQVVCNTHILQVKVRVEVGADN